MTVYADDLSTLKSIELDEDNLDLCARHFAQLIQDPLEHQALRDALRVLENAKLTMSASRPWVKNSKDLKRIGSSGFLNLSHVHVKLRFQTNKRLPSSNTDGRFPVIVWRIS